jgi:hypothetical protein
VKLSTTTTSFRPLLFREAEFGSLHTSVFTASACDKQRIRHEFHGGLPLISFPIGFVRPGILGLRGVLASAASNLLHSVSGLLDPTDDSQRAARE